LKIGIDPDNGKDHCVKGLHEITAVSLDDYIAVLKEGAKKRQVASTNMNAVSSRSHSVFTITIDQVRINLIFFVYKICNTFAELPL
jgi:hypothetical protein